jgi:hypothetical protein
VELLALGVRQQIAIEDLDQGRGRPLRRSGLGGLDGAAQVAGELGVMGGDGACRVTHGIPPSHTLGWARRGGSGTGRSPTACSLAPTSPVGIFPNRPAIIQHDEWQVTNRWMSVEYLAKPIIDEREEVPLELAAASSSTRSEVGAVVLIHRARGRGPRPRDVGMDLRIGADGVAASQYDGPTPRAVRGRRSSRPGIATPTTHETT